MEKLGFAVNAPFDLDVGRSQLAYSSSQNDNVATIAGLEIGEVLVALYRQAVANWEAFAHTLGLHGSASHLGFWESVWERLGKPLAGHPDPHGPLLRGMLWGAIDRGMRRLVSECEALPNGLWGDGRALTRLGRLHATVSGLLDSEDVYNAVAKWPSFHLKYPAHSLISGGVMKDLTRLAPEMVPCCIEVTLSASIKDELGSERRAEPSTAGKIGAFISPSFINNAASRGVTASQEIATLIADLADIQFQSRSGDWQSASCLVVSGNDDEGLRADFAPAECVLSDDYAGDALNFFRVCRNQLRADAKLLKCWALEVLDDRRKAVLKYILDGELGQALAAQLFGHTSGTWLARLEESEVVNKGFTHNEAAIILGRLGLYRSSPSPPPPPAIDPRLVLEDVHEWWEKNRGDEIRRYENRWYPQGRPLSLRHDIARNSSAEERRGWMSLFMLGAMHTMGRTRGEAHRNFLVMCEEQGWLEVFSRPTNSNLDEWMGVLKDYLDRNVSDSPYLHWMGRFVSIFQLAHWLHEYVGAFLAIEQFKHEFELDAITAIRTSRDFQGGGQDAPPVSRTLGIGACFVVRELVRTKVVNNHLSFRHCYVPSGRVRRLMSLLGCRDLEGTVVSVSERVKASGTIYDYLVDMLKDSTKARFHGDFDLPLIALTEPANRDLLSHLLRTSQADDLEQYDGEDQEVS